MLPYIISAEVLNSFVDANKRINPNLGGLLRVRSAVEEEEAWNYPLFKTG